MSDSSEAARILPDKVETGEERPARRLYAEAAERIRQLMAERKLMPGDRLPTEMELAALLDVSRATVREALVALEVSGVLVMRRNAGAIVRDPERRLSLMVMVREGGPFEQIEVRRMVEPQAAMLAAQYRTKANLDAMERALDRMHVENRTGYLSEEGDRGFHLEIARASGNSVLLGTVEDLWRMRSEGQLWPQVQRRVDFDISRPKAEREHARILAAIRGGDPAGAQAAMTVHLATVRLELEEAFGLPGAPEGDAG